MENGYLKIIKTYGFAPSESDIWISVGQTPKVQGWKIHLSIVPVSSFKLLSKVLPLIKKQNLPFKVIKNAHNLELLNSGTMGLSQCGKFITIYPDSDNKAVNLVKKLLIVTRGFYGPAIPSDLHLGGIVYARYGAFTPIIKRNRFGEEEYFIQGAEGVLQNDFRAVPFKHPNNITNPFEKLINGKDVKGSTSKNETRAIGSGYLLLNVVRNQAKGAIYTGIDLRSQNSATVKIVKQGRHDYLSDKYGRDIRDRLKRQEKLHTLLAGEVPIPRADPYFEERGNGYLPLEYIEGDSLESFVKIHCKNQHWHTILPEKQRILLTILAKLIKGLNRLHNKGYIHRDLTSSNILITKNYDVYILDFELAHKLNDKITPPYTLGTPGFMSPQQAAECSPSVADDIYSLGCIMLYIFTGMEPSRITFSNDFNRYTQLCYFAAGLNTNLVRVISRCVNTNSKERPRLIEISKAVNNSIRAVKRKRNFFSKSDNEHVNFLTKKQILQIISNGISGIFKITAQDENGLWKSHSLNNNHRDFFLNGRNSLELLRSANRGIAGTVYLLSRVLRLCPMAERNKIKSRALSALTWLFQDTESPDAEMPGLHYGQAGVAVAVAESIKSGILNKNDANATKLFNDLLLSKLDWHDVTHGAAGQGMAAYSCSDLLQDNKLYHLADRCAKYLVQTQNKDGSWQAPSGVTSIEGKIFTGFAHGVAGIIYFLSEHVRRTGDNCSKDGLQKGIDWLIKTSEINEEENSIEWPYSLDSTSKEWKWWCHGAPGIALSFLRLYELDKLPLYKEIAIKCLNVHPKKIQCINLSQCHGLTGLGEIYLEAYRVLQQAEWKERAQHISVTLYNLRNEKDNGWVWPVQDPKFITSDLMTGCSGVVHFYLRLFLEGRYIGMPLLLSPMSN